MVDHFEYFNSTNLYVLVSLDNFIKSPNKYLSFYSCVDIQHRFELIVKIA